MTITIKPKVNNSPVRLIACLLLIFSSVGGSEVYTSVDLPSQPVQCGHLFQTVSICLCLIALKKLEVISAQLFT